MNRIQFVASCSVIVALLTACNRNDPIESIVPLPAIEQTEASDKNKTSDSIVVDMLPTTRAIKLTQEQKLLAQNNNDFSFNFCRTIWQLEKRSFITSPLSLTYVLGMLNDGASGKTAQEIMQVLKFGINDKSDVNEFCKALISQAPLADPSVIIQIANVIATNKYVNLSESYKQDMYDYYDAELTSIDFSLPASLDYLNGWCNQKTSGMIPSIIDELCPSDLMVLMNAVYFKAPWTKKFDVKDTNEETFTKEDGSTTLIPMMHRKAEIQYSSNDIYSSIRLPFGSGDIWSMYILLPTEGKTVSDVISTLTNESWEQRKAVGSAIVDIKLPRFSMTSDILLNNIIASLGAPSMFNPNCAELTNICNSHQVYIGLIKQKAAIEVTEEGTRTSAVTVAKADVLLDGSKKIAEFHANRPFVYIIQEMNTKAIFFIGTYYQ